MRRILTVFCLTWALASATARAEGPAPVLVDGDRVVLIGNAFIERDQAHGFLETLLTARGPGKDVTFRNLGWSGDTVFGEAQAGFGTAADGFRHLKEHVLALKPTVIVLGYGGNEAFEGEAGLPRFLDGLDRLLTMLAETKARFVFLSPTRQEDPGRPLPDPTRHNQDLRRYRDALRKVAAARGAPFVDLFEALPDGAKADPPCPLTDDGLHLTAYGYWRVAEAVAKGLGSAPAGWRVELDQGGKAGEVRGTTLAKVESPPGGLRFEVKDATLPGLPRPADASPVGSPVWSGAERVLKIRGLSPGSHALKVDGETVAVAPAEAWAEGVAIVRGPEFDQVERLRRTIVRKNLLYFYRWRPQNETYLFGFRKHEQGQNAREIPQFDPLVAEQEAAIAKLRVPVAHVYELTRKVKVSP